MDTEGYEARKQGHFVKRTMDIFDKNGVVVAIILNNFITSDAMHFATNVASYVACADGGANRLHDDTNGLFFPNLIIGDLDSLRDDVKKHYETRQEVTKIVKAIDQNRHDLDKTLEYICKNCDHILTNHHVHKNNPTPRDDAGQKKLRVVVLGALGGRFDHDMANVNTLFKWTKNFDSLVLLSQDNMVQLLEPGYHEIEPCRKLEGPTCSLIPIGAPVKSVTTSGLKWNLSKQPLGFGALISTSNRILSETVIVNTTGNLLWTTSFAMKPWRTDGSQS